MTCCPTASWCTHPDLRGFGDAFDGPLALEDATAEAHARRVVDLLDAGGHERAVLAGDDN